MSTFLLKKVKEKLKRQNIKKLGGKKWKKKDIENKRKA